LTSLPHSFLSDAPEHPPDKATVSHISTTLTQLGYLRYSRHAFSALQRDGFCMTYGSWQRDVNTIGVPVAPRGFGQPLALGFTCLVGQPARVVLQTRIAPRLAAAAARIARDVARLHA
jgi:DNA-binding IclR family transcriptional regulator